MITAIVQARMGSSRFPGKVMEKINGTPIIELLLNRLSKSKKIDQIVIAIPLDEKNKSLENHLQEKNYKIYKGSENNVLERYFFAAKEYNANVIIRITGDCPLIDPGLIDDCLEEYESLDIDYLCNNYPPSFPDGLDVEIFSFQSLQKAYNLAVSKFDLEHVTPFIRNSPDFSKFTFKSKTNLSHVRLTLDEKEDFQVIKYVFEYFNTNTNTNTNFNYNDVIALMKKKPLIFQLNNKYARNEGSEMNKSKKLWIRAKKVIPGGNMLLSKRPTMFHPENWPTYFSKAKGCEVWDMEDVKYKDLGLMGVGTNILGYGHPEVDKAVQNSVDSGNLSTLNSFDEVLLAEKLIDMHPWADMARFARTGGEANAIAIRIARASSGKDGIAICGYHGWHDWYLASNLDNNNNLSEHLLPGLEASGVPKNLKGTVHPFQYNNFKQLKEIVETRNIGVIKMEVQRNFKPENSFLQKVRELATKFNIVLIFDECTSGFRETFGGLHLKYDVNPDIAIFGKALGNGYAITSVIGKRDIMEAAQSTFISSTFWTERIGFSAALKTLEVMERLNSWEYITSVGNDVIENWNKIANNNSLKIDISGLPCMSSFKFNEKNLELKTFITQEMLKEGYLASNTIYTCMEHTHHILQDYYIALDKVFSKIAQFNHLSDVTKHIDGNICDSGFKRLN